MPASLLNEGTPFLPHVLGAVVEEEPHGLNFEGVLQALVDSRGRRYEGIPSFRWIHEQERNRCKRTYEQIRLGTSEAAESL